MNPRLLSILLLVATGARATSFTVTLANSSAAGTSSWSAGLLTLKPLFSVGVTPTPTTDGGAYATYEFTDSNCNTNCTVGGTSDNGNALCLAQRWGLTQNTNWWLVPAMAPGASQTLTIDAPVGSTLSYIAWVNDTGVFDDFVAMHSPGNPAAMAVPLFNGSTPVDAVDFEIGGYDSNSVDPTTGNAGTCTNECPAAATDGGKCYVAPGNATYGTGGTLPPPPSSGVPAVVKVTAVSGNGQVRLAWSNNAPHSGVVIARSTSAVTWTPTNGTTYMTGQTPNAATTIAFAGNGTDVGRTDSTGLVNGKRYFYKVFAYATGHAYASGDVPSASGIFSDPTPQTGATPFWCYSVGFPSLQQPSTELNAAVFTSSNAGLLTASTTAPGTGSDGWERWRPVALQGAVQTRATLLPLLNRSGDWLVVADQSGVLSLVSSSDGALAWKTASLGTTIQMQPISQLYTYADARFQAWQPNRDSLFVGTHNTGSHTNNKVYGISSVDGTTEWTYAPTGNGQNAVNRLDWVTGTAVDYTNDRLYVASYSNGGAQNSLRVLSTLDGGVQYSFNLNDLPYGVNFRAPGGVYSEAVAINGTGTVYAYTLTQDGGAPTQRWSFATGAAPTAYAFPLSDGFITPLANNTVRRYNVALPADGGAATITQAWSTAVTNPSGVWLDYTHNWLMVGSGDGNLRQLDMSTGAVQHSVYVSDAGAIGTPTIDTTANRVHVGTADGRLCAFPNPLQ